MKKNLLIVLFACFTHCAWTQQIPIYSMYMFNGLVLNPAFAGNNGALTSMIHYRDQWTAFDGHPNTFTFMIDSPLKSNKYNLGTIFSYDKFAITKTTQILQSFAYRMPLGLSSNISFGIQAGASLVRMDWSELNAPADDQVFAINPRTTLIPKAGFGVVYTLGNFYTGVSVPQISIKTSRDTALGYVTNPGIFLNAGYSFNKNQNFQYKPSLLLKFTEPYGYQLDVNLITTYKNFLSAGASYRTGNALVFLLECRLNQLKFGYAYDYYLNSLRNVSKGSHELMLKYEFRYLVRVVDPRNFY